MAFMGTFDASKDLAKDDMKGSRDQNIQECQDIGIGSEEIDEIISGILGGILTKDIATGVTEFMVVEEDEEAKKAKEAKVAKKIKEILEVKKVKKVMVVEEDKNVKKTNIKYKLKLKFKSIEASSLSFQAVKNTNNDEVLDDFARSIREMQAARRVRDKKYRGTSANDFPQFHRQIFQQNSEDLIQGKEDLDKIEQEFQEDAKFDLAKWTNECFGNSSARVPLYARGKDKY